MTTTAQQTRPPYVPTTAQKGRAAALRRFNWLFVYGPTIFFTLVAAALMIFMLVRALPDDGEASRSLISGIADLVIIVSTVPVTILVALVPAAAITIVIQARQRKMAPLQRLQQILWQVESFLGKVQIKVNEIAPKLARPIIQGNAIFALIKHSTRTIQNLFIRS